MSKNKKYKAAIGIILFVLIGSLAVWAISGTVTKGRLGKEDIALWYDAGAIEQSFTRETSSVYDMTLHKLDWVGIDVLQVYGAGINQNKASIDLALADVGTTNRVTLWLAPSTWTIEANLDLSSYANVTLSIPPGAMLSHGAYTIKYGGPILAGGYRFMSGTGTITYVMPSDQIVYGAWDASGSDIFFYTGGTQRGLIDSSGFQETVSATNYQIPSMLTMKGYVQRAQFSWKDADEIAFQPGVYHHAGTVDQFIYWTSSIAYTADSATGCSNSSSDALRSGDIYYLYLDDSKIVTAATYLANSSCFLLVTEEPIWSEANRGWYGSAASGNATATDRCIFAVVTSATAIWPFNHEDDFVLYGGMFGDVTSQDIDDAWEVTEAVLTIPKFTNKAQVTFQTVYSGAAPGVSYWRAEDISGASLNKGHVITFTEDATAEQSYNTCIVLTADSKYLELYHTNSNASHTSIFTDGWYFGTGL